MDKETYREVIAAYAGQISMIDHYTGNLFRHLKEKGRWENTWIIFLADHGDFIGSYGLFGKGEMLDPSVKVPLIIKPANSSGFSKIDIPVSTLDIYGLILDVAGEAGWKELPGMEAKSLLPLIQEENPAGWDSRVYSLFSSSPQESTLNNLSMLRRDSLKLIRKEMGNEPALYELYDMNDDTLEIHNRYNDEKYRVLKDELQKDLDSWWSVQAGRHPDKLDMQYLKYRW
jgi:arylsulfatase A-like enzyme